MYIHRKAGSPAAWVKFIREYDSGRETGTRRDNIWPDVPFIMLTNFCLTYSLQILQAFLLINIFQT